MSQYGSDKLDNLRDVESTWVPCGSRKLLANKGLRTSRAITFDLELRFEQTYSHKKFLGEQKFKNNDY